MLIQYFDWSLFNLKNYLTSFFIGWSLFCTVMNLLFLVGEKLRMRFVLVLFELILSNVLKGIKMYSPLLETSWFFHMVVVLSMRSRIDCIRWCSKHRNHCKHNSISGWRTDVIAIYFCSGRLQICIITTSVVGLRDVFGSFEFLAWEISAFIIEVSQL